jgi:hypothetical protein
MVHEMWDSPWQRERLILLVLFWLSIGALLLGGALWFHGYTLEGYLLVGLAIIFAYMGVRISDEQFERWLLKWP